MYKSILRKKHDVSVPLNTHWDEKENHAGQWETTGVAQVPYRHTCHNFTLTLLNFALCAYIFLIHSWSDILHVGLCSDMLQFCFSDILFSALFCLGTFHSTIMNSIYFSTFLFLNSVFSKAINIIRYNSNTYF